jgi:hypothetical protein
MDTQITGHMKTLLLASVLLAGAAASSTALAQHRFHGGPRVGVGVYIGAPYYPYYSPYYYPPYSPYYYPPVVVAPAAPPVYIEQVQPQPQPQLRQVPQAAPQQPAAGWWYYCAEGQGYYPYVKQCPGGWQQVAPQPQG